MLLLAYPVLAQRPDPAQWAFSLERPVAAPGSRVVGKLTAKIDAGWHMYSLSTPKGPIATTVGLQDNPAVAGYQIYQPKPIVAFDENFKTNTETFENQVDLLILIDLKKDASDGPSELTVQTRYQVCNNRQCLLPVRKTATAQLTVDHSAAPAAVTIPSGYTLFAPEGAIAPAAASVPAGASTAVEVSTAVVASTPASSAASDKGAVGPGQSAPRSHPPAAPAPTVSEPASSAVPAEGQPILTPAIPQPTALKTSGGEARDLGMFVLIAFGFGLASIFTPCVFPMIPITVSFFLNRESGSRGRSAFQALVFSLGIVVLFSSLGLATTALLGPFGTVQLGSHPWVNGFISLVFLAFGLSLLGAFEIVIPSSVLTRMDRASERGGILGTLIMGLTFSLAAFACVGPFVGTLLAGSVSAGGWKPVAGMLAFASGLALPFFLLALFPAYLKRLPKSGSWMARVKVVLGFVILAATLKYLSNVDAVLGWNLLTRERFLAVWVVLFSLPGLYLLGFLRMEGMNSGENVGILRLLAGTVFLAFALSLVPGMFGAKLGEIDAYVPMASGQNVSSGSQNPLALTWMKNQYQEALERSRADGKLIFLNFTGYACTNCHWMKANMFSRPEIAAALGSYVLVELYTDGTDAASDLNQKILTEKFNTVAIPFYAIVDPDGRVIASFAGLTRDPGEFQHFLSSGARKS